MRKSIHSAQYKVFVRVLKDARVRAGLTQTQLAHLIGEEQTSISKVERGERRLDVIELRIFCDAMRVPLKRLLTDLESALND